MMKKGNVAILLLILGTFVVLLFFIEIKANAASPSKVNATFETLNTAPGNAFNMSIQHYILGTPNAFDYFDFNDDGRGALIADTHYVGGMPPNNGPSLNWSEGFDSEGHDVRTYLCISSSRVARDGATPNLLGGSTPACDIVDRFGLGNEILDPPLVITDSTFRFNRTHDNITYFVRMISVEITAQRLLSGNYDTAIAVVNTRPTMAFNFTTPDLPFPSSPEAHSRRPAIQWMPDPLSLDYDNGTTRDRWPGDNVTYLVTIQDLPQVTLYLNSTSLLDNSFFNNPSKWLLDLAWGTSIDGAGLVNSTYRYSIWANDSANLWSSPYTGQFNLVDFVPDVETVYMGDNFTQSLNCSIPGCFLTPFRHSNVTSINITVIAKDIDGDCSNPNDPEFNAYAHLCIYSGGSCNDQPLRYNFSYKLDKVWFKAPNNCLFNFSVTPGPGPRAPAFFIEPSNLYQFYINVSSQSGLKRSIGTDTQANGLWGYNPLFEVGYINPNPPNPPYFEAENVSVGTPSEITPGGWSNGTIRYIIYNYGNVVFATKWNSTRFLQEAGGVGCGAVPFTWTPDDTDPLQLDDDPQQPFETVGGLPLGVGLSPINLLGESPIMRFYYPGMPNSPTGGVVRCTNFNCDNSLLNETVDTYWHIRPRAPLCPGKYGAILNVEFTPYP